MFMTIMLPWYLIATFTSQDMIMISMPILNFKIFMSVIIMVACDFNASYTLSLPWYLCDNSFGILHAQVSNEEDAGEGMIVCVAGAPPLHSALGMLAAIALLALTFRA